jgi:hypothetical protein
MPPEVSAVETLIGTAVTPTTVFAAAGGMVAIGVPLVLALKVGPRIGVRVLGWINRLVG